MDKENLKTKYKSVDFHFYPNSGSIYLDGIHFKFLSVCIAVSEKCLINT